MKHLEIGGGPTVEIITTVLDLPITDDLMELCKSIVNSPIKLVLPRPSTTHVAPFAAVAGPDNTKKEGIFGCYLLASLSFMD